MTPSVCFFFSAALSVFQEGDPVDVRAYLHRDGSVIMQITVEDLQNPQALYQEVTTFCPVSCWQSVLFYSVPCWQSVMFYSIPCQQSVLYGTFNITRYIQTVQKYDDLYASTLVLAMCFFARKNFHVSGIRMCRKGGMLVTQCTSRTNTE